MIEQLTTLPGPRAKGAGASPQRTGAEDGARPQVRSAISAGRAGTVCAVVGAELTTG
jgi:hypothetical protein